MRLTGVFALLLAWGACGPAEKKPLAPITATDVVYGDTLAAGLTYEEVPDTSVRYVGYDVVITLRLRCAATRNVTVDSLRNGTYMQVDSGSSVSLIWQSTDTLVKQTVLSPGQSMVYCDTFRPVTITGSPLAAGRYRISGRIAGFYTNELSWEMAR